MPNLRRAKLLFKLALNSNPFLGVFHYLRKRVISLKTITADFPPDISLPVLTEEGHDNIRSFFTLYPEKFEKLKRIADDFIKGYVYVYNYRISIEEFKVSAFMENRKKKGIIYKDLRFYWEFCRFRFVYNIALAYCVSREEKYAVALGNLIRDWDKYSPTTNKKVPYNGMESAIKLMNVSCAHIFLNNHPTYEREIKPYLIHALIYHSNYVFNHYDITAYGLESNHGLACSVGLIYASLLFPKYRFSKKWYAFGMRVLKRSLKTQFSEDGVNFESSVQYHRFVFELLIFLLAAFHKTKSKVDANIEEKIENIGSSLKALTHKNGYIPRIGDCDGGKFLYDLGSNEEFNSMDYLNWFFKDNKERYFETLFFEDVPQIRYFISDNSCKFKVGKYISYKDSDISLVISANEIGTLGKGNHQHNDFLSFELYSNYPFIVDPWSYCYTGDRGLRNNDRKTRNHNTIEIDSRDIVEFDPDRLFEMLGNINVNIEKIVDCGQTIIFKLTHNGYKNLAKGSQVHTRKFTYDKKNSTLKINDNLSGNGKHTARYYLHIQKKYWDLEVANNELIFFKDKERFILRSNIGKFNVEECFVSENYLTNVQAYRICLEQEYENSLNIELVVDYEKRSE